MRYIITILYVFLITPRIQAQSVHFDNRMTEFLITTLLEKIYIQTDKPYYVVEDTIWMKAYVVNAQIHQPSPSNFVYIELINRLDSVEKRIKIRKENHAFCGYITLDKKLIPGEYVLRAYTNWMRNESPDYFFQKTITIGRISLHISIREKVRLDTSMINREIYWKNRGKLPGNGILMMRPTAK